MTERVAPRVAAPRGVVAPPIECPEHAVTRGGDTAFLGHSTALAGEAAPDMTRRRAGQRRAVRGRAGRRRAMRGAARAGRRLAGRRVRAGAP